MDLEIVSNYKQYSRIRVIKDILNSEILFQ
jgi:hypothetical protein